MMTAQEVPTETRPEMTANLFDLLTRSSADPDKVAIETASGAQTEQSPLALQCPAS